MLYPIESETRELKDLSGIWEFKVDKNGVGHSEKWYEKPLTDTIMMPVPASYNDITQDASVRDYVGDVWYEKTFFIPVSWREKRVIIRVGSATHSACMWVNGSKVAEHKGGYLPFEGDISELIEYGKENRVTLSVNNILDWTTLPPGEIKGYDEPIFYPDGYKTQEYFHDFFNYSGIHRPVKLYTTPKIYIDDITVVTDIMGNDGMVSYNVELKSGDRPVRVRLISECGDIIAENDSSSGKLVVPSAHLWEPGNAYLYVLQIETISEDGKAEDCYRLPVGIRTVKVTEKEFLINGKQFYFKGFGKHEDMDIKGKGLDDVINIKDFNLLKWIGANSFRTSHYPYSEEIMNIADREGIVIIDESPAVGMNFWNPQRKVFAEEHVGKSALDHHVQVMTELINRDKNHPCVVMWSVANEATTNEDGAYPYFKRVAQVTRKLDQTRPITIVNCAQPLDCKVAQMFDVICVNRYYSWYTDSGHLELIEYQVENELRAWNERFNKPVLMTEYGADAIAGFHQNPPVMFSEEYQCELLKHYHKVFDKLDFVIGEHVWNFADFATKQGTTRIMGNKKGVFTRQRHPKAAAYLLKNRWTGVE
jgi:beta-glucuronidase